MFFRLLSWTWSLYFSQRRSYRGAFPKGPKCQYPWMCTTYYPVARFWVAASRCLPSRFSADPWPLALEGPPYVSGPHTWTHDKRIEWAFGTPNHEWDQARGCVLSLREGPTSWFRAHSSLNASQPGHLGPQGLWLPRLHTALCCEMVCPTS